jgi:hypothetical protein
VSWIRKGRHPVVLSSGVFTFTSDKRVAVTRGKGSGILGSDTWKLVIDPVLERDSGLYECQVNTRDKMSLVFKINVERKFILINVRTHPLCYGDTKFAHTTFAQRHLPKDNCPERHFLIKYLLSITFTHKTFAQTSEGVAAEGVTAD